jgi:SWI/SNF-related matrix-associated actin-dependent regulator of chromatin subfamily B member 1
MMRYMIVDQESVKSVSLEGHPRGAPLPPNAKAQYVPRIRCVDCPGKLYTAGPGQTIENFEVHLANRLHKANVDKRTKGSGPK